MSEREILKRQAGITLTNVSLIDGSTGLVVDCQYVVQNEKAPLETQNFGSLDAAERFFEAELLRGPSIKKQILSQPYNVRKH
jgi:hypothetical protein